MSAAAFSFAAATALAILVATRMRPGAAAALAALLAPLSLLVARAAAEASSSSLLSFVPLLPLPVLGAVAIARSREAAGRTEAWAREVEAAARARADGRLEEERVLAQRTAAIEAQANALGEINQIAIRFGSCENAVQVRSEIRSGTQRALGGDRVEIVPIDAGNGEAEEGAGVVPAELVGRLVAPLHRTLRDGTHVMAVPLPGRAGHLWNPEAIVAWRSAAPWTDTDVRLLFALSEIAGTALQAALLAESIANEARRDGLTGLLTRKAFEEEVQKEIALAARAKRALAFALLDLDHFKALNDTHGHEAGDRALQAFAKELGAWAGVAEGPEGVVLCGRMGGEEFGVIAPGCDTAELLRRISVLRSVLRESLRRPEGEPLTFSAGVAAFPAHGLMLAELFDAADKALYHAKAAGRDQSQEFRR